MKRFRYAPLVGALFATIGMQAAAAAEINLAGQASGYMAQYNFKNWSNPESSPPVFIASGSPNWVAAGSPPSGFPPTAPWEGWTPGPGWTDANGVTFYANDSGSLTAPGSVFPYFWNPDFKVTEGSPQTGAWQSVAVTQASDTAAALAAILPANAQHLTIPEAFTSAPAAISAGTIAYDDSVLTGVGTETIALTAESFSFNNEAFSPYYSPYNTGGGLGNFPLGNYLTLSNVTGTGLTFLDGVLISIDIAAQLDIWTQIPPLVSLLPGGGMNFTGDFSISGDSYAFRYNPVDFAPGTGEIVFIGSGTQTYFDYGGTIDAVAAVPEASTYAMMMTGLGVVGFAALRRRRGADGEMKAAAA